MSRTETVPVSWRQIERALADYFRSVGAAVDPDGRGTYEVELAGPYVKDDPVPVLLSDLAQYLELELRT